MSVRVKKRNQIENCNQIWNTYLILNEYMPHTIFRTMKWIKLRVSRDEMWAPTQSFLAFIMRKMKRKEEEEEVVVFYCDLHICRKENSYGEYGGLFANKHINWVCWALGTLLPGDSVHFTSLHFSLVCFISFDVNICVDYSIAWFDFIIINISADVATLVCHFIFWN